MVVGTSRREGAGMSIMRQSTRLAVAILIIVVMAGCRAPDAQGEQDTTAADPAAGMNPEVQAPDTSETD